MLDNTIYPETKEENQAELDRMKKVVEGFEWNGWKPYLYTGKTNDIDLNQEWYCPRCNEHPKLKLNGDTLYCPTYYEICEYSFRNKADRARHEEWWSEGYKHPLSPRQLLEVKIANTKGLITNTKNRIKQDRKNVKEYEASLVELKAQLL